MYYCYSIKEGLFDNEMKYAKELGVYIFYDKEKDIFLDADNNIIDIKNKSIFPRTGVYQINTLLDAIKKHGGISLVTKSDIEKTLDWPLYIKTNRNNIIMNGKQILESRKYIVDLFGVDRIFFKTKNKNYSEILSIDKIFDSDSIFQKVLKGHESEDFIVSDVISIVEDEFGVLEYRAFIINNEIFNISRVHDFLLGDVPETILYKLKDVMCYLKTNNFSKSYVIDFFIGENEHNEVYVDVLECNPIVSSGTYLYNSVFAKSNDMLHKCPSKSIPVEKIKYGNVKEYGYNVINKPIPSICYKLNGGFAADVVALSIFGKKTNRNQFLDFSNSSNLDIGMRQIDSNNLEKNNNFNEDMFKILRLKFLNDNKNN